MADIHPIFLACIGDAEHKHGDFSLYWVDGPFLYASDRCIMVRRLTDGLPAKIVTRYRERPRRPGGAGSFQFWSLAYYRKRRVVLPDVKLVRFEAIEIAKGIGVQDMYVRLLLDHGVTQVKVPDSHHPRWPVRFCGDGFDGCLNQMMLPK